MPWKPVSRLQDVPTNQSAPRGTAPPGSRGDVAGGGSGERYSLLVFLRSFLQIKLKKNRESGRRPQSSESGKTLEKHQTSASNGGAGRLLLHEKKEGIATEHLPPDTSRESTRKKMDASPSLSRPLEEELGEPFIRVYTWRRNKG
ncbi:hypothetical protein NL676_016406 [Syzygium grande]|nr:hypothetical protein NL676_016406 [Syzygium grande]